MCFIYSSSFTAVSQSSMARAVCRQMRLISPQLSFKGQLTACPEGLVGMLWAQLNHRERKMLPQECSCERGRQIPESGLRSRNAPIPVRALTWGSNLPLSAPCITLEASKSREGISLTALPNSCHKSQHPWSCCGMKTSALPKGVHNNSQQFLLLPFPVCPSLMSTALQRDHWTYLRCDTGDKVSKCWK